MSHQWCCTSGNPMKIKILHLLPGAREATGLTVIIDVFRAFSTACYLFANGAAKILPVETLKDARQLKSMHPEYILMGERGGEKLPDFDYGNSPADIREVDFTNRTIIQTTSAGTKGLVNAVNADEVITGSYVNVYAIIDYIRKKTPQTVSLVCMGTGGREQNVEDDLCGRFIADILQNRPVDIANIIAKMRNSPSGQNFFNPEVLWARRGDFDLCTAMGCFDFVLKATKSSAGPLTLKPVKV